jgi:hypothetical protein
MVCLLDIRAGPIGFNKVRPTTFSIRVLRRRSSNQEYHSEIKFDKTQTDSSDVMYESGSAILD